MNNQLASEIKVQTLIELNNGGREISKMPVHGPAEDKHGLKIARKAKKKNKKMGRKTK
jgi:hypothetical protein